MTGGVQKGTALSPAETAMSDAPIERTLNQHSVSGHMAHEHSQQIMQASKDIQRNHQ
jgi:hypothetical protein